MTTPTHSDPPEWGYDRENGPENWFCLLPEYSPCGDGEGQSPIDLAGATVAELQPITFDYHLIPMAIFNHGRAIQVNAASGNRIIYEDKAYDLIQFHFHKPSEHTINGEMYEMELHLVHKHAASGMLAVIGVMITQGEEKNEAYRMLFDHLPAQVGTPDEKPTLQINPADLLPDDPMHFYTYEGSLTTPPCSEIVRWLIMTRPVALSAEQIATFGEIYSGNARPVQPRNKRDLFTNQG
ncbi:MAG: carbonic anhydrase family protein [Anaerolineae bacterium]|nr:carbonic anhydrase family protein [Anaerolineae bacterium]